MTNRCISEIVQEQDPLMLPPDASVALACEKMCERHLGAVLVADRENHLLGIFTGRDAVRMLGQGCDAKHTPLAAVMTSHPATIAPDAHAIDALRLMSDGGFRHLPVVVNGRVKAIVARSDFEGLELDRFEEEKSLWEHIA
ncbi:CBS domain-containing protein [Aromatoleum petrolei]|uniref:CBS domain-containing protein n=1 Tax=Aromatoleum petrolei TaxID=76116 RepID=A0ABX1MRZ0_9RHOO|nr:CBS domain-containing protein [Aromatoleum petrolei]NMF90743.1 CBS domain-containing protein [Aromatoleum petrolei]QTQ38413.1 CBS domain-containing protein [Aromatoleum petrolei]